MSHVKRVSTPLLRGDQNLRTGHALEHLFPVPDHRVDAVFVGLAIVEATIEQLCLCQWFLIHGDDRKGTSGVATIEIVADQFHPLRQERCLRQRRLGASQTVVLSSPDH